MTDGPTDGLANWKAAGGHAPVGLGAVEVGPGLHDHLHHPPPIRIDDRGVATALRPRLDDHHDVACAYGVELKSEVLLQSISSQE